VHIQTWSMKGSQDGQQTLIRTTLDMNRTGIGRMTWSSLFMACHCEKGFYR